jgi:hypothetical protein
MDEQQFDAARASLASARRHARAIEEWPRDRLPRDLDEAYRLQAVVARDVGAVAGWKVAAVTAAQRASLGVDRPIGAPLLSQWLHDARVRPAALRRADFVAPSSNARSHSSSAPTCRRAPRARIPAPRCARRSRRCALR